MLLFRFVKTYGKSLYVRTLHFLGQAAVGSVRFLNQFFIYETVNVHDNLHFYSSISNFNTETQYSAIHVFSIC